MPIREVSAFLVFVIDLMPTQVGIILPFLLRHCYRQILLLSAFSKLLIYLYAFTLIYMHRFLRAVSITT